MDLYRINLNLLIALDVLLAEQNVSNAAKKIFITQSALSNNLQQLREIFKDELLIREKNHMVLTGFAKELQPKLHRVLQDLGGLITSGQEFKPETSTRIFRIAMSDYMTDLMLPKLIYALQRCAPNIKIDIVSLYHMSSLDSFEKDEYDIGIGRIGNMPSQIKKKLLFKDRSVCIFNHKHPLAKKKNITIEDYFAYKHIMILTNNPDFPSTIEPVLAQYGLHRDIQIKMPFIVPVFKFMEKSNDLIATVLKSVASLYCDKRYVIKPLPFKTPEVEFYFAWHKRFDNDAGHQWLRDQISEIGKMLQAEK